MRLNALTRSFEQEFTSDGISYKVFGGFKFFERKEIKDLLAYLRLVNNPFDSEAAVRIINFPKRGIGARTVEALENYAYETELSVYDALWDLELMSFNAGTRQKLQAFADQVKGWIVDSQDLPVNELVRKIVADNCLNLRESYPELSNKQLGEVLLTPTKIYVKQVLEVVRNCDVHGISHITGGGFDENIPRILHEGQGLEIDEGSWEILPVFRFLEKYGKVAHREMFNIFNMGIGMVIALDAAEAQKAIGILTEQGERATVIGRVTDTEGVVIR